MFQGLVPTSRRRSAGALLLALTVLATLGACSRLKTKIDEDDVRRFIDAGLQASVERNVDALCAQIAEEAQVKLVEFRFSGSKFHTFSKTQWCDQLRASYAAIPPGITIRSSVNIRSIAIAPDRKSADISMDVTEEVGVGSRGTIRVTSQQHGQLVLQAGQLRYTELSARVTGAR